MVIRSQQKMTNEHCQFFGYQIIRALKYMHSANVIHRDLKPRNLLANSNCDLKVCDLGLARIVAPKDSPIIMSNYVATRWYRAPEIILSREKYTPAIDMWAVGCILAELINRKPLFPGRDSFHQISLIVSILGTPKPPDEDNLPKAQRNRRKNRKKRKNRGFLRSLPNKTVVPLIKVIPKATTRACDLLAKLLTFDPDSRLSAEEALKHPYFSELHFEEEEPECEPLDEQEFSFDSMKASKTDLQLLMRHEIQCHYSDTIENEDRKTDIPSYILSNDQSEPNSDEI